MADILKKKPSVRHKVILLALAAVFCLSVLLRDFLFISAAEASYHAVPQPFKLVTLSESFDEPLLKGIRLDPDDPLKLEFIIAGNDRRSVSKGQIKKIVNYFLAGLSIPEENLWVNLSPYEEDRIIDSTLAETELGEEFLKQDYILKQLASSLTHPDTESGKKYWSKGDSLKLKAVQSEALNKIWIIPHKAELYQHNDTVIINNAVLSCRAESEMSNVLLPQINQQINKGRHFTALRQFYNSLILAVWFKDRIRDALLAEFAGSARVKGIDLAEDRIKEKVYLYYRVSFEKGAYDVIRRGLPEPESREPRENRKARRFFSGGVELDRLSSAITYAESALVDIDENFVSSSVRFEVLNSHAASSVTAETRAREIIETAKTQVMDLFLKNDLADELKTLLKNNGEITDEELRGKAQAMLEKGGELFLTRMERTILSSQKRLAQTINMAIRSRTENFKSALERINKCTVETSAEEMDKALEAAKAMLKDIQRDMEITQEDAEIVKGLKVKFIREIRESFDTADSFIYRTKSEAVEKNKNMINKEISVYVREFTARGKEGDVDELKNFAVEQKKRFEFTARTYFTGEINPVRTKFISEFNSSLNEKVDDCVNKTENERKKYLTEKSADTLSEFENLLPLGESEIFIESGELQSLLEKLSALDVELLKEFDKYSFDGSEELWQEVLTRINRNYGFIGRKMDQEKAEKIDQYAGSIKIELGRVLNEIYVSLDKKTDPDDMKRRYMQGLDSFIAEQNLVSETIGEQKKIEFEKYFDQNIIYRIKLFYGFIDRITVSRDSLNIALNLARRIRAYGSAEGLQTVTENYENLTAELEGFQDMLTGVLEENRMKIGEKNIDIVDLSTLLSGTDRLKKEADDEIKTFSRRRLKLHNVKLILTGLTEDEDFIPYQFEEDFKFWKINRPAHNYFTEPDSGLFRQYTISIVEILLDNIKETIDGLIKELEDNSIRIDTSAVVRELSLLDYPGKETQIRELERLSTVVAGDREKGIIMINGLFDLNAAAGGLSKLRKIISGYRSDLFRAYIAQKRITGIVDHYAVLEEAYTYYANEVKEKLMILNGENTTSNNNTPPAGIAPEKLLLAQAEQKKQQQEAQAGARKRIDSIKLLASRDAESTDAEAVDFARKLLGRIEVYEQAQKDNEESRRRNDEIRKIARDVQDIEEEIKAYGAELKESDGPFDVQKILGEFSEYETAVDGLISGMLDLNPDIEGSRVKRVFLDNRKAALGSVIRAIAAAGEKDLENLLSTFASADDPEKNTETEDRIEKVLTDYISVVRLFIDISGEETDLLIANFKIAVARAQLERERILSRMKDNIKAARLAEQLSSDGRAPAVYRDRSIGRSNGVQSGKIVFPGFDPAKTQHSSMFNITNAMRLSSVNPENAGQDARVTLDVSLAEFLSESSGKRIDCYTGQSGHTVVMTQNALLAALISTAAIRKNIAGNNPDINRTVIAAPASDDNAIVQMYLMLAEENPLIVFNAMMNLIKEEKKSDLNIELLRIDFLNDVKRRKKDRERLIEAAKLALMRKEYGQYYEACITVNDNLHRFEGLPDRDLNDVSNKTEYKRLLGIKKAILDEIPLSYDELRKIEDTIVSNSLFDLLAVSKLIAENTVYETTEDFAVNVIMKSVYPDRDRFYLPKYLTDKTAAERFKAETVEPRSVGSLNVVNMGNDFDAGVINMGEFDRKMENMTAQSVYIMNTLSAGYCPTNTAGNKLDLSASQKRQTALRTALANVLKAVNSDRGGIPQNIIEAAFVKYDIEYGTGPFLMLPSMQENLRKEYRNIYAAFKTQPMRKAAFDYAYDMILRLESITRLYEEMSGKNDPDTAVEIAVLAGEIDRLVSEPDRVETQFREVKSLIKDLLLQKYRASYNKAVSDNIIKVYVNTVVPLHRMFNDMLEKLFNTPGGSLRDDYRRLTDQKPYIIAGILRLEEWLSAADKSVNSIQKSFCVYVNGRYFFKLKDAFEEFYNIKFARLLEINLFFQDMNSRIDNRANVPLTIDDAEEFYEEFQGIVELMRKQRKHNVVYLEGIVSGFIEGLIARLGQEYRGIVPAGNIDGQLFINIASYLYDLDHMFVMLTDRLRDRTNFSTGELDAVVFAAETVDYLGRARFGNSNGLDLLNQFTPDRFREPSMVKVVREQLSIYDKKQIHGFAELKALLLNIDEAVFILQESYYWITEPAQLSEAMNESIRIKNMLADAVVRYPLFADKVSEVYMPRLQLIDQRLDDLKERMGLGPTYPASPHLPELSVHADADEDIVTGQYRIPDVPASEQQSSGTRIAAEKSFDPGKTRITTPVEEAGRCFTSHLSYVDIREKVQDPVDSLIKLKLSNGDLDEMLPGIRFLVGLVNTQDPETVDVFNEFLAKLLDGTMITVEQLYEYLDVIQDSTVEPDDILLSEELEELPPVDVEEAKQKPVNPLAGYPTTGIVASLENGLDETLERAGKTKELMETGKEILTFLSGDDLLDSEKKDVEQDIRAFLAGYKELEASFNEKPMESLVNMCADILSQASRADINVSSSAAGVGGLDITDIRSSMNISGSPVSLNISSAAGAGILGIRYDILAVRTLTGKELLLSLR